jgi:predicted amidohydrolase YtcJ
VGKLADIVVLPVNPLTVAPEKLLATPVAMTLVGGKVVYRSSERR